MNQEQEAAAAARYRAFVSYSHTDGKFAVWLHRKLEGSRLPDGNRLAPIFIDRAELAAGPDLSAQVREALSASAALLVIASPAARASRWVAQEIALFRELHPDRPVLAALVHGDPAEAFPDDLLNQGGAAIEPLAADFRDGQDGKRLGLLKIVAGLSAQPLDRLVQRDAQSRQRRVMAVTAGAVILSLILAGLLVLALRARADAERQRAEAEGLVEYMLTDLRDKLKGVGSPTIMASVNDRALVYYSRMDVTSLPDDSLERRARVLHAMGEDNERLGNFPAAQKLYLEAWRITNEVLKRHPKDPDAIFAHAQSEFWVGKVAWEQGDLETTSLHWRGYLAAAESLTKAQPMSKRSLMELGFANGNLCELAARRGQPLQEALALCEASTNFMVIAQRSNPFDPEIALALANRLGWQADLLARSGKLEAAIRLRRREAGEIASLLESDPDNVRYQERRIWPDIGIGFAYLEAHQPDKALSILTNCLARLNVLQSVNPDNLGITEQRLRVAGLAARAARQARSLAYPGLIHEARTILTKLKPKLPSPKASSYSEMIERISKEERI